jgi:hypothetical protein
MKFGSVKRHYTVDITVPLGGLQGFLFIVDAYGTLVGSGSGD